MDKGLIFPNNHFLSPTHAIRRCTLGAFMSLLYFAIASTHFFSAYNARKRAIVSERGKKGKSSAKIENHSMANFTFVPFMAHILSTLLYPPNSLLIEPEYVHERNVKGRHRTRFYP